MDISQLCEAIELQPEVQKRVALYSDGFDFRTVEKQLNSFLIYEKAKEAHIALQTVLGEDEDGIKILSCMLYASANAYAIYKARGISDQIYYDTMKCYTRFIDETYRITGKYCFDRYWWTALEAGCHLFRIGALEYEVKRLSEKTLIGIHIPSDADLSPSAVEHSIAMAKKFLANCIPEVTVSEYLCHTWLLDQQLRGMLTEHSNIRKFQDRFYIFDEGEAGTQFVDWLFQSRTTDYASLPENTSLQRKVKKHILSGGVIRNSYGRLKNDGM